MQKDRKFLHLKKNEEGYMTNWPLPNAAGEKIIIINYTDQKFKHRISERGYGWKIPDDVILDHEITLKHLKSTKDHNNKNNFHGLVKFIKRGLITLLNINWCSDDIEDDGFGLSLNEIRKAHEKLSYNFFSTREGVWIGKDSGFWLEDHLNGHSPEFRRIKKIILKPSADRLSHEDWDGVTIFHKD